MFQFYCSRSTWLECLWALNIFILFWEFAILAMFSGLAVTTLSVENVPLQFWYSWENLYNLWSYGFYFALIGPFIHLERETISQNTERPTLSIINLTEYKNAFTTGRTELIKRTWQYESVMVRMIFTKPPADERGEMKSSQLAGFYLPPCGSI